jgi:hypothetical protein
MPNCTTYHNDKARTGWFRRTRHGVADASQWRKHLDVNLGSAVRGAPLLLEGWKISEGPHKGEKHDLLFVTTSNNLVNAYAVDQYASVITWVAKANLTLIAISGSGRSNRHGSNSLYEAPNQSGIRKLALGTRRSV